MIKEGRGRRRTESKIAILWKKISEQFHLMKICTFAASRLLVPETPTKHDHLRKALKEAAKLRKQFPAKDIRIELGPGRYELEKTLLITDAFSSAKGKLIFSAAPGTRASISGGKVVSGWSDGQANGVDCWVADVPELKKNAHYFTQLWVNGSRRNRPKLPSKDYFHFDGFVGPMPKALDWYNGPDQIKFKPGDLKKFRNMQDVHIVIYQLWFEMRHRIKELDFKNNIVHFFCKSIGHLLDEKNEFARFFVDNVFEAFGQPGEWYLDREAGKLFYTPLPGETKESCEVIVPQLSELLRIEGKSQKFPARNIVFENIDFEHVDFKLPQESCGYVQACTGIPGAVRLLNTHDSVFYNCAFRHVAQYGLEIGGGAHNNKVVACHFFDLGAGGVKVAHEDPSVLGQLHEPLARVKPLTEKRPSAATWITDCVVHDGGKLFPSSIGIFIGDSGRNRVLHNHVFDVMYTGISVGWTWGYAPSRTVDNRIEFNHIHHINWNNVLSDNGAIYTLGRQPGSTIKGNVVHHVSCYGYGGWGIYPDEGSSEFLIEDNVVYRTKNAGFFVHYGRDLWVRNNIFANSEHAHFNPGRTEWHRTCLAERNIISWNDGEIGTISSRLDSHFYLLRNNVLHKKTGGMVKVNGLPLSFLQKQGQWTGSLGKNPQFVGEEYDDYRLSADSQAITELGFKPFDSSKAGPRMVNPLPRSFAQWPFKCVPEKLALVTTQFSFVSNKPSAVNGVREVILKVEFENRGDASGGAAVALNVSDNAKLKGPKKLKVNLKPGKSISYLVPIHIENTDCNLSLNTYPDNTCFRPASFMYDDRKRLIDWIDEGPATIPHVRKSLEKKQANLVSVMGTTIANVRFGFFGGFLGLLAEVNDLEIIPNPELPWGGSCIELNVSHQVDWKPGQPVIMKQHFIVPESSSPAQLLVFVDPVPQLAPRQADFEFEKVQTGYRLLALIALKELSIPANAREFRIEIQVNSKCFVDLPRMASTLFGSINHTGSLEKYATVRKVG